MRLGHIIIFLVVPSLAFGQIHWVKLNTPTPYSLNRLCFIDSVRGWVAGDSGTVLRTTNGGQSWEVQDTGMRSNIIDFFMLDQSYGWGVALQYAMGTILIRTTNGGVTWSRDIYPGEYFYAITFVDSANGVMGGNQGKLKTTTDGGSTWSPAVVDSSNASGFPVLRLAFFSHNYGYALGGRIDLAGIIWRTTNGGRRWTVANPDSVGEPLHGIHFFDSLNIIAVGGDFDRGSGMVRSKDGGQSWLYTFLGIWGEARAISFRTPSEGIVPLGFPGTYMVTEDTGVTWHDFFTPDSSAVFDVTFTDSLHGYMVGINGTFLKYDPTIDRVSPEMTDIPTTTTLFQNFPNPFNPNTRISYRLTFASFVSLKVFDVLGREVVTLFRGHAPAGVHEVEFNGDVYPSGVYYYELSTTSARDRATQVRKMLLVK